MSSNPRIWLRWRDQHGSLVWLGFERPIKTVVAARPADVVPALAEVDAAVEAGLWAAGFVTYEAAPGLDPTLMVRPGGTLPCAWFGLFERPDCVCAEVPPFCAGGGAGFQAVPWTPTMDKDGFEQSIGKIRAYLAAGDTYQVNLSFRLRGPAPVSTEAVFAAMALAQETDYAAYVDTGSRAILSVSPELFFRVDGERMACRPMKGTARRGLGTSADDAAADALACSPKNRAENVMIVDMIRNDLGRVAEPGTVVVESLFQVERYRTVLQMTSTVSAKSRAGLADLMCAMFPCASVTGAPKRRTMEIIAELENQPRGIYTGAIGFWGPGRVGQFSVAIRTMHVDRVTGIAEYGVGAGVVWDSVAADEHVECMDKARVLFSRPEEFRLVETMLWTPARGIRLPDAHMNRLRGSARYFGFAFDERLLRETVASAVSELEPAPHRVRLTLGRGGDAAVESSPLGSLRGRDRSVALASCPVSSADPLLYHKTSSRGLYERTMAGAGGFDDVLLWNERGELTESCIANVAVCRGGRWVTPPVSCGLLPGVLRERLVARGNVVEDVVPVSSLRDGEVLLLLNSVRGIMRARLRIQTRRQ